MHQMKPLLIQRKMNDLYIRYWIVHTSTVSSFRNCGIILIHFSQIAPNSLFDIYSNSLILFVHPIMLLPSLHYNHKCCRCYHNMVFCTIQLLLILSGLRFVFHYLVLNYFVWYRNSFKIDIHIKKTPQQTDCTYWLIIIIITRNHTSNVHNFIAGKVQMS